MARCPLAPLDRTEENILCRVTFGLADVGSLPMGFLARLAALGLIEERHGQLALTDLGRQRADEAFERELAAYAATCDNVVVFTRLFPRHRLH
jgi:hypothetical protein